jgi:hypothetical protein
MAEYLFSLLIARPAIFLRRWYVDFSRLFWARVIEGGAAFDRQFAVKIMLKTLFLPLYGDYTVIGRILGPIFRFGRILIALPFIGAYFAFALFVWIVWLAIPITLLLRLIR